MMIKVKYITAWAILAGILVSGGVITRTAMKFDNSANIAKVETVAEEKSTAAVQTAESDPEVKPSDNKPEITKYVVKQGDTLWDIASQYKVDTEKIASANNLSSPDSLKIGQEIIIPGADTIITANVESKPQNSDNTKQQSIKKADEKKSSNTSNSKPSTNVKVASRSGSLPAQETLSISGIWPVNGHVTSKYGYRGKEFHKGIDIAAPNGTPVYAFTDGIVVSSGRDNGGYGNLVIIDHGNGIQTYYAHNSKLLVSAGEQVKKGQQIAEVGKTGEATGYHCHFEIRKNGNPQNPLKYIK